jgi:hypothetical protein
VLEKGSDTMLSTNTSNWELCVICQINTPDSLSCATEKGRDTLFDAINKRQDDVYRRLYDKFNSLSYFPRHLRLQRFVRSSNVFNWINELAAFNALKFAIFLDSLLSTNNTIVPVYLWQGGEVNKSHINTEIVFKRALALANVREEVTVEKVLACPIGLLSTKITIVPVYLWQGFITRLHSRH